MHKVPGQSRAYAEWPLAPLGTPPEPFVSRQCFGRPAVFLFGGEQNVKVYVLDIPSRKWSVVPIPRRNKLYLSSHSAFLVGDKVFLTNGHQPTMRQKPRAAVYIYFDLILGEYGKFEVEGPDLQLYGALAGAYVEDLDEIVVYGGSESGRATANIRAFNVAQRKWRAPVVRGVVHHSESITRHVYTERTIYTSLADVGYHTTVRRVSFCCSVDQSGFSGARSFGTPGPRHE